MSVEENHHSDVSVPIENSLPQPSVDSNQKDQIDTNLSVGSRSEIILQPIFQSNVPSEAQVSFPRVSLNSSNRHRSLLSTCSITIGCILFLIIIVLSIPIAQLVIGIKYLHQCPIQSNIPIYLIVSASVCIFALFFGFLHFVFAERDFPKYLKWFSRIIIGLLSLFGFIWLIIGSVWTYSIANRVQHIDPNGSNYCHEVLYRFSYAITILFYISSFFSCCQRCFQ
ncbi:hypothetical protein I4U23_005764 [Adineta vaga]|nr:hypothetical protein I4U23_005764 [Adineta vaga]